MGCRIEIGVMRGCHRVGMKMKDEWKSTTMGDEPECAMRGDK